MKSIKNLFGTLTLALGLITALSLNGFAQHHGQASNVDPVLKKAQTTYNASTLELRSGMRFLWAQHMEWTYAAVTAFFTTTRNYDATAARLLQNQEDIGNAIKPFYGDAAGNALAQLLKEHIIAVVEVMTAAKRGEQDKLGVAVDGAYRNAQEIGDFLSSANQYWSKDFARDMLKTHIDQTLVYATAIQHDDFAEGINSYGEAEEHMMELADALSDGLIAAFPEKFTK